MARRSKTLDELATLRERVVAANMRRRDAEQAQTDAQAQLRRLHDERVNALADEDEARAGKIASAIADLGRRVDGDLGQRLEGAALAARRAEAEVARFRAANFERIEAERAPAGEALTARYEEALRALVDVDRAWHAHQASRSPTPRRRRVSTCGACRTSTPATSPATLVACSPAGR